MPASLSVALLKSLYWSTSCTSSGSPVLTASCKTESPNISKQSPSTTPPQVHENMRLGASAVLTGPSLRVAVCRVHRVSEQHPGRLQVTQTHGQLQRGPTPRIQVLHVVLHSQRRNNPPSIISALQCNICKSSQPLPLLTSFFVSSRSSSKYWLFHTRKCRGKASWAMVVVDRDTLVKTFRDNGAQ